MDSKESKKNEKEGIDYISKSAYNSNGEAET